MSQHFPVLIVLLPLSAALLSPFFSYLHRQAGKWIAILSLVGAFLVRWVFCCRLWQMAVRPFIIGWATGCHPLGMNL